MTKKWKGTDSISAPARVDPENVDKRRAEVGLGTLADYIGHWNLTWDIKKHKERVAKIETKAKKGK